MFFEMLPMLLLLFSFLTNYAFAQDQNYFFRNSQQPRFLPNFQNSNVFYQNPNAFQPSASGFNNAAQSYSSQRNGFSQEQFNTAADLQTSDLPPHLAQTLPQYQFPFPSPTVRQPIPFQDPPKLQQTAYLYEDTEGNQQILRPQPFQPSKHIVPSTYKPPHSHYLSHNHNRNPAQTETFLGQITLQSPDLSSLRSKDYSFQQPHSLVDQFSPDTDKWKKTQLAPKPTRSRTGNKSFKELTESVDQSLDSSEDKFRSSKETIQKNRRPTATPHLDRPLVPNRTNFRTRIVNNPESSLKTKNNVENYISNTGEVPQFNRNEFKYRTTTTETPISNRFNSRTKPPSFIRKNVATTTTENNSFDIESLLEDSIHENNDNHKDDVQVIGSVTTEDNPHIVNEMDFNDNETSVSSENTSEETTVNPATDILNNSATTAKSVDKNNEEEYYYYEDDDGESSSTSLYSEELLEEEEEEENKVKLNTTSDEQNVSQNNLETQLDEDDNNSNSNNKETEKTSDQEYAEHATTEDSSFDILTMKPSPMTVEHTNFSDFVDSTLIDNITEEPVYTTNTNSEEVNNDGANTAKNEPVLIGEAIVSVVTTKSVVNGTYSTPSPTVAPPVTEQMKAPESFENTSEGWVVVASVQTSRSVSGARYLNFPVQNVQKPLNKEETTESTEISATETTEEETTTIETPSKPTLIISSTESINDKLDRVQSELSGYISGDFSNGGNNITLITETVPSETTTTTTTTTTTVSPVKIRKFSANNRPTTTRSPKRPKIFENVKVQDDLTGLLPAGFKPRTQNYKTTSTESSSVDIDIPQADEAPKQNKTVIIQEDISSLLSAGHKPLNDENNETKDPIKTLEGKNNKSKSTNKLLSNAKQVDISAFLPPGFTTAEPSKTTTSPLLAKAQPVDISAFLPPGYKLPTNTDKSEKQNNSSPSLLAKATPVDISAFLPPGYKSKSEKQNDSSLLAKATPVDISAFLPPGYKPKPEKQNDSSALLAKSTPVDVSAFLPAGYNKSNKLATTTEKSKGINKLLEEAKPVDISAFLPAGYKPKFTTKKPPTTLETVQSSTENTVSSTNAPSTTASAGFKVVFPSRPGGIKPSRKLTTPKSLDSGPGVQTAPSIHKGWPSRATTEFTGWPTPSTTPISIEKLLEAARTATSHISSTEDFSTVSSTTPTTTTTTTTTPRSTTPGICVSECNVGGSIKLIGGAKWIPELLDRNTREWQILANEVEIQLEKVYSKSEILNRWYKKVTVEEFSPGSIIVDYSVELTDLGRQVDTQELKKLFHETLQSSPIPATASGRSIDYSETPKKNNFTQLALGNFIVDPRYTDFIVLAKQNVPTVGYADENVFLPQWAIAVIVIGLASLLFVIIFGVTVLVNRQKNAKKKQPTPLTEDMLNELNKNHMSGLGGLDNYGAEDLYNMEDVWNDRPYDVKPPKKQRSSGSIHDNSMSNLYDSWRSEWNGYYYNAYYGTNPGSSNSGYARRRSDYDTNF